MARIVTNDHAVRTDATTLRDAAVTLVSIALRLYLALVWLRFGVAKLQGGWLTTNPLRQLLSAVAAGQLPTTAPGYAYVARALVGMHADALLSVMIPCTEVAIGIALIAGVRLRTVALIACAINANLLLAGIASFALDGRMIVLQIMLIALATLAPSEARRIFPAWRK